MKVGNARAQVIQTTTATSEEDNARLSSTGTKIVEHSVDYEEEPDHAFDFRGLKPDRGRLQSYLSSGKKPALEQQRDSAAHLNTISSTPGCSTISTRQTSRRPTSPSAAPAAVSSKTTSRGASSSTPRPGPSAASTTGAWEAGDTTGRGPGKGGSRTGNEGKGPGKGCQDREGIGAGPGTRARDRAREAAGLGTDGNGDQRT